MYFCVMYVYNVSKYLKSCICIYKYKSGSLIYVEKQKRNKKTTGYCSNKYKTLQAIFQHSFTHFSVLIIKTLP